jgi:phage-related protein
MPDRLKTGASAPASPAYPSTWELVQAAGAQSPVEREIRKAKLNRTERAHLQELLDRIAAGRALPRDTTRIVGHHALMEARLDGNHRIFRLIYAPLANGSRVLLALLFTPKKSERLSPPDFKEAERRLKQHLAN